MDAGSIRLAVEIAGFVSGLLIAYWKLASQVTTWQKDLRVAKEQIAALDEKIDELIVSVALLNAGKTRSQRGEKQ